MAINIARRKVIAALGGTAVARPRAWLLAARARQPERMRRIGVLNAILRGRSGSTGRITAFLPTMPSAIAKMRPN